MSSFTTKLIRSGVHAGVIPVPEAIAIQSRKEYGKRVLCTIHGISISCALQWSEKLGYYIMAGTATRKQFQLQETSPFIVTLSADLVPIDERIPEVLQEVLSSDPVGHDCYTALTEGKKRTILHLIQNAKSMDTKINRSLRIIENLKRGKTNPKDFLKPLD